ncbi:beta-1,3-galactosyltransferase 5-like isoform X3 [Cherax quadricarinatus]|uniref:beta-1,3-galactosyltransferase 5-like isoform X3 n=1 Tax=Cherax quadricarinatus TaxID=27406 RepID=UPI00387E7A4C
MAFHQWLGARTFWLLTLVVLIFFWISYARLFTFTEAGLNISVTSPRDGHFSRSHVYVSNKTYRSQDFRQLIASWDRHYKAEARIKGEVLNHYPDQVRFSFEVKETCEEPPLVLAMVVTSVENWRQRHFVRHSWGHPALAQRTGIRPLFVVGEVGDPKLQAMLVKESQRHGDVIQANFIDTYNNLTYKTTALITWAFQNCPNTPFILKIDDDVIPNPLALRDFLIVYLQQHPHPVEIMGSVRRCDEALREGKWAVSNETYPDERYPPFVAGPSYLLPMTVIPVLLQAIRRTKFLYLEDVYTTGLAARLACLAHYDLTSLTNFLPQDMDYYWCTGSTVFQQNVDLEEGMRGWNLLRKREKLSDPPAYDLPTIHHTHTS